MRMRRKKNLDARLSACNYLITACDNDLNFKTAVESKDFLNFAELFGNTNPVHLEIGCGKGQFAVEAARRCPDINFLAVEKSGNVIVEACEKAEAVGLPNLRFFKCSAQYLPKYIPESSIERIYLNFSCPFPKKSYAAHRLTHRDFLFMYREMLAPGAEIHQKTDNRGLFEFSLEQFSEAGFCIKNVSLDLHADECPDNIMTEYEQRFVSLGFPIYRLEAYMK